MAHRFAIVMQKLGVPGFYANSSFRAMDLNVDGQFPPCTCLHVCTCTCSHVCTLVYLDMCFLCISGCICAWVCVDEASG